MTKIFNIPELAGLLGVSTETIRRELQKGRIPHMRIGAQYLFTIPDIQSYIGPDRAHSLLDPDDYPMAKLRLIGGDKNTKLELREQAFRLMSELRTVVGKVNDVVREYDKDVFYRGE